MRPGNPVHLALIASTYLSGIVLDADLCLGEQRAELT
jgi:hypothetical protein